MLGTLVTLIIVLLVIGILYWAIKQIPLPIPGWIIDVIFALICVVVLLDLLLGGGTIPRLKW